MDISNDTRIIANFNKHVDRSGTCHIWTGAKRPGGYGLFGVYKKTKSAHRIAYEIANGPFDPGKQVDHMCFNRACVNPAHLRLVTSKQNGENRAGATVRSKTGIRGVSWHAHYKKWWVQASHYGKKYSGGLHDSLEEADLAAQALRNRLFTHNSLDRKTT